jgi:hypothetical protein
VEVAYKLPEFFGLLLQDLQCHPNTRAYLVGLFSDFKSANHDLSKQSITLAYANARSTQNFIAFQCLGDWLLYCQSFYPKSLSTASPEYYHSIGRLSYYACYRLLQRKFLIYEELADNLIQLEEQIRELLETKLPGNAPLNSRLL